MGDVIDWLQRMTVCHLGTYDILPWSTPFAFRRVRRQTCPSQRLEIRPHRIDHRLHEVNVFGALENFPTVALQN
jgi:hypothetical protein